MTAPPPDGPAGDTRPEWLRHLPGPGGPEGGPGAPGYGWGPAPSEGRRGAGKSWEELNENGIAIWGNPETVIKKITYLHERCQVGHLMMMMQAGFMPTKHTRHNLKLFAEEVYPAVRELGEPLVAPQEATA